MTTFGALRSFIALKVEALGFKEWKDGFNVSNIPSNILNKTFHVELGNISARPVDNLVHGFDVPVTVRVFFKGYRDPMTAKDTSLDAANEILNALLKPTVRLSGIDNLKDVRPVSVRPVPLADSNDNSLILEMVFTVLINYRFE